MEKMKIERTMMVKLQLVTASMHIAAGCFMASAAKYGRVSFVHQQVKPRSFGRHTLILNRVGAPVPVPVLLHAANGEPIDPISALYDDDILPLPSTSSSWGVADDWSNLSSPSSAAASTTFASTSSPPLPSMNGNCDAMEEAARILEEHDQILSEWDGSEDNDENASTRDSTYVKSSNNSDFVEDAIEMIASNSDYYEADGVQLYDTASSTSPPSVTTVTKAEANGSKKEEDEIAFMIRCNQSPEQFLISQGRALPELTDDIKYSANFLLEERQTSGSAEAIVLPLQPKATALLKDSVKKIFDTYSVQVKEEEEGVSMKVLDREAVSKWMTTCIASPITSFETVRDTNSKPWRDITTKSFTIGPYDRHISAVLSRYSQNHGSGYLTLEEFQALYLEVTWAGYIKDVKEKKLVLDQNGVATRVNIPSSEESVIIKGKKNTEKMLKEASLSLIWRDLEAHEIFSPAEEERVQQLLELEKLQASLTTTSMGGKNSQPLMDECVLFDDYADRLSHQSYADENDSDMLGVERAWDFLKERKEKSSYKLVEMAYDGKTPKRIRDGEHVFIDEESCIGCTQCAQIAPSVFKMIEDTGRARTYFQRNVEDVENAVMSCPVSCMHMVSFDELKELEEARDVGDGRTDHRHFGGRKTHTPLNVAGIGSDANHKSSWYHYLKWKCHGSSSCPQRGCYQCPTYATGENPNFKARHKQSEHIRAKDFMDSGEADKWRKVVEL